jgi:hypothetical protein
MSQDKALQVIPVRYEPRTSYCGTKYKDRSNFQNILEELELTHVQKEIIRTRYLSILENFQRRTRSYSTIFFIGHFMITVGSLLVPALMSIQNSDKDMTFSGVNFPIHMYWATFIISVLVTTFNGILTLFKVDKKYYFLNTTLERLRSEGWQYFGLTGRYSGHLINHRQPTHTNQFMFFIHYVEKIKMKQVEEEYYKADEKPVNVTSGSNHAPTTSTGSQELYPPSPDQPLISMTANMPDPVKDAVNSLIKSSKTIESNTAQLDKEQNVIVIPIASQEIMIPLDADNQTSQAAKE